MEDKIIDQSELAKSVADKIDYDFLDYFLVKPLDAIKVKKEFSTPVANDVPKKDKEGIEAQDFSEVKTEIKEVDSDYRKAVVIKVPLSYKKQLEDENAAKYLYEVKQGDIVILRDTAGLRFDLLKDSRLVRIYAILGIEQANIEKA